MLASGVVLMRPLLLPHAAPWLLDGRGLPAERQHAIERGVQEDLKALGEDLDNHRDLGELVRIEAILLVLQQQAQAVEGALDGCEVLQGIAPGAGLVVRG